MWYPGRMGTYNYSLFNGLVSMRRAADKKPETHWQANGFGSKSTYQAGWKE